MNHAYVPITLESITWFLQNRGYTIYYFNTWVLCRIMSYLWDNFFSNDRVLRGVWVGQTTYMVNQHHCDYLAVWLVVRWSDFFWDQSSQVHIKRNSLWPDCKESIVSARIWDYRRSARMAFLCPGPIGLSPSRDCLDTLSRCVPH